MSLLRTLAASVKLPDRLPQSSGRRGGGIGGLALGIDRSGRAGMAAYKEIGAAYGPIRRLCQATSRTTWDLYSQDSSTPGNTNRTLIDNAEAPAHHPATALWTKPNPFMTRRVFLYQHQLWKVTQGGVYWIIVKGGKSGSPFPERNQQQADIELWPIRKDRIIPISDDDNYVAGYYYVKGVEKIPLPVQAVIPIGWPDPEDPLDFAGPLQAIMTDLESERFASQYQRNLFLNGARPGGAIEFDAPLDDTRFEELVDRWREQHQGVNNAARVAIIEGGKWVETVAKNTDMEYRQLRLLDRETVMFSLGMPFAVMQTNDVNLANALTADKQFYRHSLAPELEDIKEPLNERVLPLIGDNLLMDFNLPAPEDEAFDTYAAGVGFLSGYLQQNEARLATGHDAIDGGDKFVYELNGGAPLPILTTPPKKPTGLSYRKSHAAADGHAAVMETSWTPRLADVQAQYLALLEARNGK